MQVFKTIIKFIILHRWNKISSDGIDIINKWKNKPTKGIRKIVFDYVVKLNTP